VVISIGMAIASLDELQRRIQTEAIAIGFAGTAIFVGGYALFQFAGLSEVNVGLVLFAMSGFWLAGKLCCELNAIGLKRTWQMLWMCLGKP